MTEEHDPADLEPIRREIHTEDGRTVVVEVPWQAEAPPFLRLIEGT